MAFISCSPPLFAGTDLFLPSNLRHQCTQSIHFLLLLSFSVDPSPFRLKIFLSIRGAILSIASLPGRLVIHDRIRGGVL